MSFMIAARLPMMTLMILMMAGIAAGALAQSAVSNTVDEDTRMVQKIFETALESGETYKNLEYLSKKIGTRLSGSQGAARSVEWTEKLMKDYGFDQVFLQEVMVPHWERGDAEIARLGNADGQALNVLAIGGSVATPKAGITAEVVEVFSLDEVDELGEAGVKGKIVFYNRPFDHRNIVTGAGYGGAVDQRVRGASRAAKYGAAAVVIRSVTSSFDDQPHTGTLVYSEDQPRIPAAALGIQSADRLTAYLKANKSAKLYLKMNCVWHPDARSYNVVGELRGSTMPEEIIVVGGHLDSWDIGDGSHDDGAGCMQSVGVLRMFQKLGITPQRTLRAVMFMNEENGTRGGRKYAALAAENNEKHLIAIESDAGGFSPRGFGVTASDAALAKIRSWLPHFHPNTVSYFRKGGGGADIRFLNQQLGVPTAGMITDGQRLFDVHHSANDVFESVNRRELELGTASMAAFVYLLDKYGL